MSKIIKRKYHKVRAAFKRDLYAAAKANPAIAMLMIETYTAHQHSLHIMAIWELLGFHHRAAYKDYCDKLIGKHLTGRNEVMRSLYFACRPLCTAYDRKIPKTFAMGDALAVAYKVLAEEHLLNQGPADEKTMSRGEMCDVQSR